MALVINVFYRTKNVNVKYAVNTENVEEGDSIDYLKNLIVTEYNHNATNKLFVDDQNIVLYTLDDPSDTPQHKIFNDDVIKNNTIYCFKLKCKPEQSHIPKNIMTGNNLSNNKIVTYLENNTVKIIEKTHTYIGEHNNGYPNGKGYMHSTYENGYRKYEGMFEKGKYCGIGKLIDKFDNYTTPCVMEGTFLNNKLHGHGKHTFPTGNYCEGDFDENNWFLSGKYVFINHRVDEGKFIGKTDSLLHGHGTRVYSSGHIQKGEFDHGTFVCGTYTYPSGDIYEGNFVNGYLHGQGKLVQTSGNTVEGNFDKGSIVRGKVICSFGLIKEGNFVNGVLNGQGKVIYSSGTIKEGNFVNGVLHEQEKIIHSLVPES
jgi:hypothetical protein